MRPPPKILLFINCVLFVSLASAQVVIKDTVEIKPRIPFHPSFIVPNPPPTPKPTPRTKFLTASHWGSIATVEFGFINEVSDNVRMYLQYNLTIDAFIERYFQFYLYPQQMGPYVFHIQTIPAGSQLTMQGKVNADPFYSTYPPGEGMYMYWANYGGGASSVSVNEAGDSALFVYDVLAELEYHIYGTALLYVVDGEKTLKILEHQPWSIWPTLPPQKKGESRGADRSGYNPKRGFTIKVLDGSNQPVKAEEVKIFTTFEQGSGGHGHTNGDKALPQDKQGLFYWKEKNGNPLFLKTDTNGVVEIDSLVASQVSGKYLVTASIVSDTTIKDTVNLEVKVPSLVNFRDIIVLDERPFIFAQSGTGNANHPSNTWCASEMGNNLFTAILDFYVWTQTAKGGGIAMSVSLNDMSLPWGGYFDIAAGWNVDHPSHSFHRVGLSVDINKGSMNAVHLKQLTDSMKKFTGIRNREKPQIHYGFNGGN